MLWIIGLILACSVAYKLYRKVFPAPNINPIGKYVLITGCDSGFGHGLAVRLDKQGFNVLAAVYLSTSINSLKEKLTSNATVFRLDITNQEDIDAAYDLVKSKTNVLHALVNNAGIVTSGNIDWADLNSFRQLMDVNFFGHVAMTKKFLGLLIAKPDSRVVNTSSMCGYISLPGSSGYSATKYALESFSDGLRREMSPWSLRVSIIEPGSMRTAMTENLDQSLKKIWTRLPTDVQNRWGMKYFEGITDLAINSPLVRHAENPEKVVRALEHAVMSTAPRIRYRPGWQSSLIFYPLSMLPAWLLDKLLSFSFTVKPDGTKFQLPD